MIIEKIDKNTYFLKNRGHEMTLTQKNDCWEMWTTNAAVKAYGRGFMVPKIFSNLEAVERAYKSWQGITKLHALAETE